jgi:hypothetical protein
VPTVGILAQVRRWFNFTPPPPPPVSFQPLVIGKVLSSFGVTLSNPATISTASNQFQLFKIGGNQFLDVPGTTTLFKKTYYIVAGGTVVTPASATNASLNFVLTLKGFSQGTQPAVAIKDDVLATLPSAQAIFPSTILWRMVCKTSGTQSGITGPQSNRAAGQLSAEYMISIGGVVSEGTLVSSNNPFLVSELQFSLGAQFSGSVSGEDVFQVNLLQFETQQK